MTDVLLRDRVAVPVEMTADPGFARRIKRLILISAVALGLLFFLAVATTKSGLMTRSLLLAGWVLMPLLLAASLVGPVWRYLLAVPAGLMTFGLAAVALGFEGPATAGLGWWLITAGLLLGGTIGGWFWYRWVPVPRVFDRPFSVGRWALIAVHAGLVVVGSGLVVFAELL